MRKKNDFLQRHEYVVAKEMLVTCDYDNSLLVTGHCDGLQIIGEDEAEYHLLLKVSVPKKAFSESIDEAKRRESIAESIFFTTLEVPAASIGGGAQIPQKTALEHCLATPLMELPMNAIQKQIVQVCEVTPTESCRLRYEQAPAAFPSQTKKNKNKKTKKR